MSGRGGASELQSAPIGGLGDVPGLGGAAGAHRRWTLEAILRQGLAELAADGVPTERIEPAVATSRERLDELEGEPVVVVAPPAGTDEKAALELLRSAHRASTRLCVIVTGSERRAAMARSAREAGFPRILAARIPADAERDFILGRLAALLAFRDGSS